MLGKCTDCRFFRYTQGLDNMVQCHRELPQVVLLGNLLTRKLLTNLFVSVTDDCFCGEFQPKTDFIEAEMQAGS